MSKAEDLPATAIYLVKGKSKKAKTKYSKPSLIITWMSLENQYRIFSQNGKSSIN